MAGKRKPTPREAFNDNMRDAEVLVALAKAVTNKRSRRVRAEMRARVGTALKIPKKQQGSIECIDSSDLFVVFRPTGSLEPADLEDLRPLLRQALVAACAAMETFVADRVSERVGKAVTSSKKPARLLELPMTVQDWFEIDNYQRKRRGLSEYVKRHIRREIASPSPEQIGKAFSVVGEQDLWKRIDARRGVAKG